MDISVIICCYNSSSTIKTTLDHLAKQSLNGLKCEVLLVDNNCTDDTVKLAEKVWKQLETPFSLTIINEQNPGLSYARKAGVIASKSEVIIFCDDDNFLNDDFLLKAIYRLKSSETIGIIGGRSLPKSSQSLPDWFNKYSAGYAVGQQASETGVVNLRGYVWGSCMVIRSSLAKAIFSETNFLTTDRVESQLISGGDVEICLRARLLGYDIFYDEDLVFHHFIHEKKLTEEYRDKLFESFQEASQKLQLYYVLLAVKELNLLGKSILIIRSVLNIILSFLISEKLKYKRNFFLQLFALTGFCNAKYISAKERTIRGSFN